MSLRPPKAIIVGNAQSQSQAGIHGSNIVLGHNGLRVLEQLGLWEDLEHVGTHYDGVDIFGSEGAHWVAVSYFGEFRSSYGYLLLSVIRSTLLQTLWKQIDDKYIDLGKKVVTVQENAFGVLVQCADDTQYTGDFVVGADGAWSKTRQAMLDNLMTKSPQTIPKSDLEPIPSEYKTGPSPIDLGLSLQKVGPSPTAVKKMAQSATCARLESRKGQSWTVPNGQTLTRAEMKKYRQNWTSLGESLGELLDQGITLVKVNLEEKLYETWHDSRIVLMGDAANKMTTFAGQGGNHTIEDAVVLTNVLHHYLHLGTPQYQGVTANLLKRAFAIYAEIWKPPVRPILTQSKTNGNIFTIPNWMWYVMARLVLGHTPTRILFATSDALYCTQPVLRFAGYIPNKASVKLLEHERFY